MPKQVRVRRGTTAQHATFTGADGEVTYDTTRKCLVLHDGVTAGGKPITGFLVLTPGDLLNIQALAGRLGVTGGDADNRSVLIDHGMSVAGQMDLDGLVRIKQLALQQTSLNYGSTVNLAFDSFASYRLNLAGNVVFTSSGYSFGAYLLLKILADGSLRTLGFPAGWKFVGAAAPASIAANKTALLHLWCFGTTENDVVAHYLVQP